MDSVLSWLTLPKENRPQFVLCYFNEPDKSGHIYGPNSNEVIESIQRADKILGKLIEGLKKNKIKANLIIVSDHGMREISRKRVIILDDYLPEITNITTYGSGPVLQLDSNDENIYDKLKDILHLSVYTKYNLPKGYTKNKKKFKWESFIFAYRWCRK